MRGRVEWFRMAFLLLIGTGVLLALQEPAAAAPRYRVTLTTLSAGEDAFERFGHTVLTIEDHVVPAASVYSFGTFDGDAPNQLHKALHKRLRYWVVAMSPLLMTLRYDHREGAVQELALDDPQAALLSAQLARAVLPENREYPYDLFTDNCVTRIRDHLDAATGGALRRQTAGPAPYTFRQEVMQNLVAVPLIAAVATLIYGPYTDVPRSRWETLFLPEALRHAIPDLQLGEGSTARPMLQKESRYKGEFWKPPHQLPHPLWLAGLFALPVLYGLFCKVRGQDSRARVVLGVVAALLSLLMGLVGLVLCYLRTTPHLCFQNNGNSLLIHPYVLMVAPLFFMLAGAWLGPRGRQILVLLVTLAALFPVGHFVVGHLVGHCTQVHGAVWIVSAALHTTLMVIACLYYQSRADA